MNTDKYKTRLEEEKALLEKELSGIAVPNEQAPGGYQAKEDDFSSEPASLDPNEVGTELESLARNEAVTNELEQRLVQVDKALAAIEAGNYGICEVSGEPIEEDRLEANPAATTCKAHME